MTTPIGSNVPSTSPKWMAMILYDEGRLGYAGIFGCKSREEAIAWLERAFNWKLCWFLKPSCYIREQD